MVEKGRLNIRAGSVGQLGETIHIVIWISIFIYVVSRKQDIQWSSGELRRGGNHPTYLIWFNERMAEMQIPLSPPLRKGEILRQFHRSSPLL